jgi:hypothetical protein
VTVVLEGESIKARTEGVPESYCVVSKYIKVKVSRYRPEQALGDPEVKTPGFLDFRHYEGGKAVILTHRPSLPPGGFLVHIFRG